MPTFHKHQELEDMAEKYGAGGDVDYAIKDFLPFVPKYAALEVRNSKILRAA